MLETWPLSRTVWWIGAAARRTRCVGLALVTGLAFAQTVPLDVQVSTERVPPGGTAQIKVTLPNAHGILSGRVVMDLDPTVFGDIAAVDAFSSSGDQVGVADIQGRHVNVAFSSGSGGLGLTAGLPVVAVTVPVLQSAASGSAAVTISDGGSPWVDLGNFKLALNVKPGAVAVGGTLAVSGVTPGGGMLRTGALVRIDGAGFSPQTTVAIDGVPTSPAQYVSSTQMNVTLGASGDLTGRRVVVRNADGAEVQFFSELRPTSVQRPPGFFGAVPANLQPIFPSALYPASRDYFLFPGSAIALENQTSKPMDVYFRDVTVTISGVFYKDAGTVTLPPGGQLIEEGNDRVDANPRTALQILPAFPLRMLLFSNPARRGPQAQATFSLAELEGLPVSQPVLFPPGSSRTETAFVFNWKAGLPPPTPRPYWVQVSDLAGPFTVSIATESGGPWLSASPTQGTFCSSVSFSGDCSQTTPTATKITVAVDPGQLTPGTYKGSFTITPSGAFNSPSTFGVVFNVGADPVISSDRTALDQSWAIGSPIPTTTLNISSNGSPVPVTATVTTDSGGDWLSITPSATTPAALTVTYNPAAVEGTYSGKITIAGPGNTLIISAKLSLVPSQPGPPRIAPASLSFAARAGGSPPGAQAISVFSMDSFTVSVTTESGGNWLVATPNFGPGVSRASVTVDPTGLAPGTYQGAVAITLGASLTRVPVTLTVYTDLPALTASPASLALSLSVRAAINGKMRVESGGLPVDVTVLATTENGVRWLYVVDPFMPPGISVPPAHTPVDVIVSVDSSGLAAGVYRGAVTITAPAGSSNSITVPVTLTLTPLSGPPRVDAIVNAASQSSGPLAPDEIVTIYGANIGPTAPVIGNGATLLAGVRVLFDGVPAPLLYVSSSQVNAVVPPEVAGAASAVTLEYNLARSNVVAITLAPVSPAIFAVANQDNTANSRQNPAARGSVVHIFATGAGVAKLPVAATIGGVNAPVQFAGQAPGAVPGLFQVNALVPPNATAGLAVPVRILIGESRSQDGVTIAVK